ncbi:MAG: MASE3 domain-containing protein [Candidatus Aquicultor sp.]
MEIDTKVSTRRNVSSYISVIIGLLIVVGLYLASLYSYNLFHSLAELFSIIVAAGIFMIAWNSRRFLNNNYLLFIGIAYLFIGGVDLLHTLAYKDMGVFHGYSPNLATQLWVAGRYMESIALLLAPLFLGRRLGVKPVFVGYMAVMVALLLSLFYWHNFPVAFIEGSGLTPFKKISEYVISLILLGSLIPLYKKRYAFDPGVLRLLIASIVVTIAQEMSFTLYTDPFGFTNMIGHFLKILAFFLVYKAIIETGLAQPYSLLFRELKQSEEALRQSEERFRLLIAGVKDYAIYMLNPDGLVASWNEGAERIKGYAADEIIGDHFSRFYTNDQTKADKPAEELKSALAEGMFQEEGWRVRKDSSRFWANVTITPVYDAAGNHHGFTKIVRDMTERKRADALSEALDNIKAVISSTLEFDDIMQGVIIDSTKAIGAEAAGIILREGDHWVAKYLYGVSENLVGQVLSDDQAKATVMAATSKTPVVSLDTFHDERLDPGVMKSFGLRSLIAIPLTLEDKAIGTLVFGYVSSPVAFTDVQVEFASKLGAAVSIAMENARLYEAEHRIADTLQAAILTVPQNIRGIEFGYHYRSATEAAKIGGDFYDFFELGGDRVGFAVGDVSGKGLEAAAITSMVKSTMRAFAYRDCNPSCVLAETNNAIGRQLSLGQFVTAIYGVIDLVTGSISMASAGHPDPFTCGEDGCVQPSAHRNYPLGIFPDTDFDMFEVKLAPGDSMVLFTDGLIEAKRGSELFGDDRVHQTLNIVYRESVNEIIDALLTSVGEFAGHRFSDDMAIVAFRYMGVAPGAEHDRENDKGRHLAYNTLRYEFSAVHLQQVERDLAHLLCIQEQSGNEMCSQPYHVLDGIEVLLTNTRRLHLIATHLKRIRKPIGSMLTELRQRFFPLVI